MALSTQMDLEAFVTRGLGDSTYLIGSAGEAVVVDPQRDADRFVEAAEARGWRIVGVLETHVHNDYLSGALEIRARTGATIAAPARGGYAFDHRPVDDGDEVTAGGLRFVARATPGHTPEHISWDVIEDGSAPVAVLTGGSLLAGSVGRTDLLGDEQADELTLPSSRHSAVSRRCRRGSASCRPTVSAASAWPGRLSATGSRRSASSSPAIPS